MAFRPAASTTTSIGGLVWLLGRRLTGWIAGGSPGWSTATRALAVSAGHSGAARWGISAISHGFWALFLCAATVTTVLLLGTRQYVLVWETTILSAESFVPLTQAVGAAPAALGFAVPGLEEIEASRWTGPGSGASSRTPGPSG